MQKAMHKNLFILLAVMLYVAGLFYLAPLLSQKENFIGKEIKSIEFYGLKNRTPDELYKIITSRYNKPLEQKALNEDLHLLFATGYFSNVIVRLKSIKTKGVALIYEVTELPQIEEINYVGVDELSTQDFILSLGIKAGDTFSLEKVRDAVQTVIKTYREKGFFNIEAWYKVSKTNKTDNKLKIYILVDEGKIIPISKINIIGASILDSDDLLNILEQKESETLSEAVFQKDKFESDKFRIISFAKSQGLLNAEIDPSSTHYELRWRNPKKKEDGRVVVITYKIIEGDIKYYAGYSLEHIPEKINQEINPPERKIKSNEQLKPIYPPKGLLRLLEFSEFDIGNYFDEPRYFRDRGRLQEAYASQGYVFAQIRPYPIDFKLEQQTLSRYEKCISKKEPLKKEDLKCRQDAKLLKLKELKKWLKKNPSKEGISMRHVHFKLSENNLAYVENIIIRGNKKTKSEVILREILIKEGQLFNSSLVNLSRQRLVNLQFFSEVNLQMRPGSSQDKMNIIFEVKEQPTGNISVGGTYNVTSNFALNMQLGENNYEGSGQKVSGQLNYGINTRSIALNWTEPWFYEACSNSTGRFLEKYKRWF